MMTSDFGVYIFKMFDVLDIFLRKVDEFMVRLLFVFMCV